MLHSSSPPLMYQVSGEFCSWLESPDLWTTSLLPVRVLAWSLLFCSYFSLSPYWNVAVDLLCKVEMRSRLQFSFFKHGSFKTKPLMTQVSLVGFLQQNCLGTVCMHWCSKSEESPLLVYQGHLNMGLMLGWSTSTIHCSSVLAVPLTNERCYF